MAARSAGKDPVAAVIRELQASTLFAGRITRMDEEERLGFYFTVVTLEGGGAFAGSQARLTIKNETMLLEVDGKARAIFPDLVLLLEPGSGRGMMSIELKPGMDVVLAGLPCHPRLREAARDPVGRRAFSPERYGRPDLSYRPMEELAFA